MPELPVIQNLNPTVLKTTSSAEMLFRQPASGGSAFHAPEQRFDPNALPTIPFVRNSLATL
jgi:hypothetical protein